ncbi:FAD-dependent oxidoreductase [Streptomyces sp. DT224]|uniref:FAD-dependent oxidoreductase n=1 Tax=Streptomyces sp. DT224 TaxID=3393426 RepID=UPI003CEF0FE4
MTRSAHDRTADVVVVGSGLGAVAAALAAARAGRTVVLAAARTRLGGQATTQLVPALDEHPHIETGGASSSYAAFRAAIRAQYDGVDNPGGGWVSRLCCEPAAAEKALETLLAPHIAAGRLTVLRQLTPLAVHKDGDRVTGIDFRAPGKKPVTTLTGEIFCDATEAGDLLPMAGAPWVCGSEGRDAYGESLALPGPARPGAVQSCTVGFVVETAPPEETGPVGDAPAGYARWREAQPFTLEIAGWDGRAHRYRMFEDGPDGHLPFWTYRRLREGAVLGGRDAALINWAGNDYADTSVLEEPDRAYTEAKQLSEAFLYWLRTECPRDDGGLGYPELRLVPEVSGTADGYAEEPYLRESRRLRTARPVRQQDLEPVPGRARAAGFADSGGLAMYHMDLHSRVGHPQSAYAPTAPFQIPLSALVAPAPVNLLAAAKNLGATQVAASAYRVHQGEWAVGEAAGALAAQACLRSLPPAQVVADRRELTLLQGALAGSGVPLAWTLDVGPGHPHFVAVQLLAAAGALTGPRAAQLTADPEAPVTDSALASLREAAARLLGDQGPAPVPTPDLTGTTWAQTAEALWSTVAQALPTRAENE